MKLRTALLAMRVRTRSAWRTARAGNSGRSPTADRIEIYNEAMDLSRFGSNNYQSLLRDFLQTKYADKKIDVAIAILSPSLDFRQVT